MRKKIEGVFFYRCATFIGVPHFTNLDPYFVKVGTRLSTFTGIKYRLVSLDLMLFVQSMSRSGSLAYRDSTVQPLDFIVVRERPVG